jgi:hypothetical protein
MSETLEEKLYEYQPTDDEGRPIGGKQVIKYTTHEELADKLREQNVLLIRKLRQETKKNRLGIIEQEELPENVERFTGATEFKPRELSEEERYDIARKLLDPTTAAEATQMLIEARVGAPLDTLGNEINSLRQDNVNLRAKIEAEAFVRDNPDYYNCEENSQTIISWILRYELAPVKSNFQLAYDTLKKQGALVLGPAIKPVEAPVIAEPTPVTESPANEVIREEIPQEPVALPPSGLTREMSSSDGPTPQAGNEIVYELVVNGQIRRLTGLAAVQAMPGEEYKRRLLHDKNFGKIVDKLEAEAAASRRRG